MKKTQKVRKSTDDKNFVGLTQKLFVLLEVLGKQAKSGLPLEQITALSGIPKTTVHRLLYSMNKLGYVEQDQATNCYALSGKFYELGTNALPYQRMIQIARPFMQRLLLTFGESVNLAVNHEDTVIFVLVLESTKAHRVAATVGISSQLHSTAVGKSIAAHLSAEERELRLTRYGMPQMTPTTITSISAFEEELARVRQEGVAIDNEENVQGVICVGGPIFASSKSPIGALSVSGPSIRMSNNLPSIKNAVRDTVRTIGLLLGNTSRGS